MLSWGFMLRFGADERNARISALLLKDPCALTDAVDCLHPTKAGSESCDFPVDLLIARDHAAVFLTNRPRSPRCWIWVFSWRICWSRSSIASLSSVIFV